MLQLLKEVREEKRQSEMLLVTDKFLNPEQNEEETMGWSRRCFTEKMQSPYRRDTKNRQRGEKLAHIFSLEENGTRCVGL